VYPVAVTVAVACNLSDGVVLAVDSAVTLPAADGSVEKIYENAEKLFPLLDRPIGMAVYGLGALGDRSIGSYLREFELQNAVVVDRNSPLPDVVEEARTFLLDAYMREVRPALEQSLGKAWDQMNDNEKPTLGVVIGGFSPKAFLSEVWHLVLPRHEAAGSAEKVFGQGAFGSSWYAMSGPIRRYIKGRDGQLIERVIDYMEKRSAPLTAAETQEIHELLDEYEYEIPYGAMPMEEGVAHARFLVELVVNHHRYATGAPVVGGRVHVGKVNYRHGAFELVH
jgi:hypothetical protein